MKLFSTMLPLCVVLIASMIIQQTSATRCLVDGSTAVCESDDQQEIVPQNLQTNVNLTKLHINYVGSPAALISPAFDRYIYLREVKIKGNINKIGEGLFEKQKFLTKIFITDTLVSDIPSTLVTTRFHSPLHWLNLERNKLSNIPLKLFGNIPQLQKLNLANNCIKRSKCFLGDEFKYLKNLRDLNLSGLKFSYLTCVTQRNINNNQSGIFQPINSHLQHLKLANTTGLLVRGHPEHIDHFESLTTLDLSGIGILSTCPRKHLGELFKHLPISLKMLKLRLLRTPLGISDMKRCYLTADNMTALRSLPYLTILDFKYSDFIFGHNINIDLFSSVQGLQHLNLGYCRISVITPTTFQNLFNLTELILDGNPLGSRVIRLQGKNNTIKQLSMKRCGLASDESAVFHPVSSLIKRVNGIDLSGNFLRYNPLFVIGKQTGTGTLLKEDQCAAKSGTNNFTTAVSHKYLEYIVMDDNYIREFLPAGANLDREQYCSLMVNLSRISMVDNLLYDITGMCESVTKLHLRDNKLGSRWEENSKAIKLLRNIDTLDLSLNQISSLDSNLFSKMKPLRKLYLTFNSIINLPNGLFQYNSNLETLDIAYNRLQHFDHQVIINLSAMKDLRLNDNRITRFDRDLLQGLSEGRKKRLSLEGNPITCGCEVPYLKSWLTDPQNVNIKLKNPQTIRCEGKTGVPVIEYIPDHTYCFVIEPLKYTGVALACLCCAFLIAWPCYKYRWYVKHPKVVIRAVIEGVRAAKQDLQCEFDAYIAYDHDSTADCEFVADVLQPVLEGGVENEEPTKLYIFHRDSKVGAIQHDERITAMNKSRKIIVVLSNSYVTSSECQGEASLAGHEAYGSMYYQPQKIIVLIRETLNDNPNFSDSISSLLTEHVINLSRAESDQELSKIWSRVQRFISKPKHSYRRRIPYRHQVLDTRVTTADSQTTQNDIELT